MKVTKILKYDESSDLEIELFIAGVKAGFASPAESYSETISFAKQYIKNPASTFFVKVQGDSMIDAGIFDGDTLIVDRSLDCRKYKIIIAAVDNDFTVKKIKVVGKKIFSKAENENFPDVEIKENEELLIWGIATFNIHPLL